MNTESELVKKSVSFHIAKWYVVGGVKLKCWSISAVNTSCRRCLSNYSLKFEYERKKKRLGKVNK